MILWSGFVCCLSNTNAKLAVLDGLNHSEQDWLSYLDEHALNENPPAFRLDLLTHELQHHGQLIHYAYGNRLGFPASWHDRYTGRLPVKSSEKIWQSCTRLKNRFNFRFPIESGENLSYNGNSMNKESPISTRRWAPLIGFIALSMMVVVLFVFAILEALVFHSLAVALLVLLTILLLTGLYYEGRGLLQNGSIEKINTKQALRDFAGVFLGALITYILAHDLGLGAVVAASVVGLIAGLILPDDGAAIYCGAFVGMTSNNLLFDHGELALAGVFSGVLFFITRPVFVGVGGRLGTIALVGSTLAGGILSREFLFTPIPGLQLCSHIMLVSLIAAVATFALSLHRDTGPVIASSVAGLVGGLLLPILFPVNGSTLAVVAICASFTGMSSKERIPNMGWMVLAGLFTGAVFIFSIPCLGGAGGKLGTIAFGSVLAVGGIRQLNYMIARQNR